MGCLLGVFITAVRTVSQGNEALLEMILPAIYLIFNMGLTEKYEWGSQCFSELFTHVLSLIFTTTIHGAPHTSREVNTNLRAWFSRLGRFKYYFFPSKISGMELPRIVTLYENLHIGDELSSTITLIHGSIHCRWEWRVLADEKWFYLPF